MRKVIQVMIGLGLLGSYSQSTNAGAVLRLSDFSSDNTPTSNLDASLEFSVSGSTLTLEVTNNTPVAGGFDISDVYFNAPPHITGLMFGVPSDGWVISLGERADGFGIFDFGILSDQGHNDPGEIGPGEVLEFEFTILGTGPFGEIDFVSQLSSIPPGNRPAIAAIKFVNGPRDDSAYGAVIPEPATVSLVLMGLGLLANRSRRGI